MILKTPGGMFVKIDIELRRSDQPGVVSVFVGDPKKRAPSNYIFRGEEDETILRGHFLRVAALIGDSQLYAQLEERTAGPGFEPVQSSKRIGDVTAVGTTIEVTNGESDTSLFLGLDSTVRDRLLASKDLERQMEDVYSRERRDHEGPYATYLVDPDGLTFEVETAGSLREEVSHENLDE